LHVRRDVPTAASRTRPALLIGRRELLLLEFGKEHVERAIEHLGDVTRGNLMAQELLRTIELIAEALPHAEVQREASRRQRCNGRPRRRGLDWRRSGPRDGFNWPRGQLRDWCFE